MNTELRAALAGFDGKAISYLSETGVTYGDASDYLASLVDLASVRDAHIDSGATWLLKEHLERGGALPPAMVSALLQALAGEPSWGAALHILQSVRFLDLTAVNAVPSADLICRYTQSERPFLRAWATDAIWRIAKTNPHLKPQSEAALAAAKDDPAASVRARARQLIKET